VAYTPIDVGPQTLALSMANGAEQMLIGGKSFEYNVISGVPDPDHSIAYGNGIRDAWSGVPTEFVVEARDAAGNLNSSHPLNIRVQFSPGSSQQQVTVEHQGDGRYRVAYTLPVSGTYKVSVLAHAQGSTRPNDRCHIRGSPFQLCVHTRLGKDSPRQSSPSRDIPRRSSHRRDSSPRPSSPCQPHTARSSPAPTDTELRRPVFARGNNSPRKAVNSPSNTPSQAHSCSLHGQRASSPRLSSSRTGSSPRPSSPRYLELNESLRIRMSLSRYGHSSSDQK
jgi:hypothetical protein